MHTLHHTPSFARPPAFTSRHTAMSKAAAPASLEGEAQMGISSGDGGGTRERLLEEPMKLIGFVHTHISPRCVQGRFVVNEKSAQVYDVLHGGVSALIAESVASLGAHVASGFKRIAGLQLSINHLKAAPIGTEVFVSAEPFQIGKRIQVWDVTLSKVADPSKEDNEENSKIAVSRVTLMVGLTGQVKEYFEQELKLHARL